MKAVSGDPVVGAVLGFVLLGFVIYSMFKGWTAIPRVGTLERSKAPRAFRIINALLAALSAYLMYNAFVY